MANKPPHLRPVDSDKKMNSKMRTQDLALDVFKECEGKASKIESKDGPLVVVKQVFRNPSRGNMIDALVVTGDGSEKTVPFTSLFRA